MDIIRVYVGKLSGYKQFFTDNRIIRTYLNPDIKLQWRTTEKVAIQFPVKVSRRRVLQLFQKRKANYPTFEEEILLGEVKIKLPDRFRLLRRGGNVLYLVLSASTKRYKIIPVTFDLVQGQDKSDVKLLKDLR